MAKVCTISIDPKINGRINYVYGSAESISPSPPITYTHEYANGIVVVWKPESQPFATNCDGTIEGIKVICNFRDGNLEVTPNKNGHLVIVKTLYEPLASPVMCNLIYINPHNGEIRIIENAITLYPPIYVNG
jgi:hypothetical protein